MTKYKYAFIDGNWLLSRNYYAMLNSVVGRVPTGFPENIASSVLSSVFNITKGFDIGKIIFVWDTAPYNKQGLLSGSYKGSRYYPTEEAAEEIEDPIEKEKVLIDAYNFSQRSLGKLKLKSLGKIGLPSVYRKGYEADDLVYILGAMSYENNDDQILFISIDSDWEYWLSPNCDLYNPKREVITTYQDSVANATIDPKDMSLFEFKVLYDSFYGSHNDLVKTINDDLYNDDCHDIFRRFRKEGFTKELFSDPDLARAQVESFDFKSYRDYNYIDMIYRSLGCIGSIGTLSSLAKTLNEILIPINTSSFEHYYSTLDSKLFLE